jgi:PAS domain S-box-containing protein
MDKTTIRVLYVDDYSLDRALVRDALMSSGLDFELVEATTRKQFTSRLHDTTYDLILSDFNILGFTGLEVLDTVRKQLPGTPVIIVTGTGSEEIAAEAMKRGASDYIIKSPSQIRRLPHLIQTALEAQQLKNKHEKAIQALRESEEKYRTMVDQAGAALFLHDMKGNIVDVNLTTVSRYRYSEEELLKLNARDIDPDYIEREDEGRFWQKVSKSSPVVFEARHRKKDGITFPVEVSLNPVTLQGEQFIMALAQDIRERKQTEEEILHSRELMLSLSKIAEVIQQVYDPDQIFQTIGEEVRKMGFDISILLLSADGNYLEHIYSTFDPKTLKAAEKLTGLTPKDFHFSLKSGIFFQKIIEKGQTQLSPPGGGPIDEALPGLLKPIAKQLASILNLDQVIYAPLWIGDQVEGLFAVMGSGLSELDVPAVNMFANQAGISLQNARSRDLLQRQSEELRTLTSRLSETEEAERRHLARELHDQVGQSLAILGLNLKLVQGNLPSDCKAAVAESLDNALEAVSEISSQIRGIMDDLRPSILDDYGLLAALHWYGDRFSDQTKIETQVIGNPLNPRLPNDIETALFRITQEALTNVARHAQAEKATLVVQETGKQIVLEIQDNGKGFCPEPTTKESEQRGWGVITMRERAEGIGATFEIESKENEGTMIRIRLKREVIK